MLERLARLGFKDAAIVGEHHGKAVVRVRTEKGWVYEKFASDADLNAWADKVNAEPARRFPKRIGAK